jgi:putative tricarboxylic transport membrane protein
VLIVSTVGVWSLSSSSVDLMLTGAAGVIGYYMRRHAWPIEPLVLGLILGGRMESSYRQALIISKGSPAIFLEKPISLVLLLGAVAFLVVPPILAKLKRGQPLREALAGGEV